MTGTQPRERQRREGKEKPKGRPRSFDRETALERALTLFWQHGYEATSISGLTKAMGISPPSLYAAFGDKRSLFEEAVARYQESYGAFTPRALTEEPTARGAMERVLREAAAEFTAPGRPHGCLVTSGAVNCGPESADVEAALRGMREAGKHAIHDRMVSGVRTGELPAGTDTKALAQYYAAVFQGMSTQARDGASRSELEALAELAMRAWPG
ncbi:TetR/AcrR family transcriptional regulator [Streptomyces sp. NPDC054933]